MELDNNYFLQVTNNINNLPKNVLDIKKLNLIKILKVNYLTLFLHIL